MRGKPKMARKLLIALLTITIVSVAWASALNQTFSSKSPENNGNLELSYTLTVQEGYYLADHTLYVSVPPSVHEYYAAKNYVLNGPGDYPKLVTPEAVKSIAENIRIATNATPYADEEFANAVLAIVHEIPYLKSNAKYSVETL